MQFQLRDSIQPFRKNQYLDLQQTVVVFGLDVFRISARGESHDLSKLADATLTNARRSTLKSFNALVLTRDNELLILNVNGDFLFFDAREVAVHDDVRISLENVGCGSPKEVAVNGAQETGAWSSF